MANEIFLGSEAQASIFWGGGVGGKLACLFCFVFVVVVVVV